MNTFHQDRTRAFVIAGVVAAIAIALAALCLSMVRGDMKAAITRPPLVDGTTQKAVTTGCAAPLLNLPVIGFAAYPKDGQTCRDYSRGVALDNVDQTAFRWDAACVAQHGGVLRSELNLPSTGNTENDLLPSATGTRDPAQFAECVVLTPSTADCEKFRSTFSTSALSARQAAVLERLGCTNTDTRPLG